MTTFDNREQAFETKFAHDEQLRFKVTNRRNKLLGLWAAERLGKSAAEAATYAKDVILSDFAEIGDDDVLQKVLTDLQKGGIDIQQAELRSKMTALLTVAKQEVMTE